MTTRADTFFAVSPKPTPHTKHTKHKQDRGPKYVIEWQRLQEWRPTLDPFSVTKSQGYRKLEACRTSRLRSYNRVIFRLRRLIDSHIIKETNHISLD